MTAQSDQNQVLRNVSVQHAMHLADIQATHNEKNVVVDDVVDDAKKIFEFLTGTTQSANIVELHNG